MAYPTVVYILYDECSEEVRVEYSSAKYTMRNYETLKKLLGLKWPLAKVSYKERVYTVSFDATAA